jgi:hypothetical protein
MTTPRPRSTKSFRMRKADRSTAAPGSALPTAPIRLNTWLATHRGCVLLKMTLRNGRHTSEQVDLAAWHPRIRARRPMNGFRRLLHALDAILGLNVGQEDEILRRPGGCRIRADQRDAGPCPTGGGVLPHQSALRFNASAARERRTYIPSARRYRSSNVSCSSTSAASCLRMRISWRSTFTSNPADFASA